MKKIEDTYIPKGRFGDEPLRFFEAVYQHQAPWAIGHAQPALLNLMERFPPKEPILDVGCGTGETAYDLAKLGYRVTGIDFVPSAIETARARINQEPDIALRSRLEFLLGDGLHPQTLNRTFGSVVDSGFLHLFDEDQGAEYLRNLALVIPAGGRGYFIEFAVEFGISNTPRAITEAGVNTLLQKAPVWKVVDFGEAEFKNRVGPAKASCFCLERT